MRQAGLITATGSVPRVPRPRLAQVAVGVMPSAGCAPRSYRLRHRHRRPRRRHRQRRHRRPARRRPHPRRRRPRPRRRCCLTTISSAEPNFRCSGAMERWGRAAVPCAPTVACPATRPSWRPRATGTRIVSWRWPTNWHPPHAPILRAQTPGPAGPPCITVAVGTLPQAQTILTAMRRTTTKTASARAPDRCACCPHPWHGLVRGNFISLYHLSFLCTRFVCGDLFSLDIVTCASRLHRFCHIGFLELAGARHGAG